MGYHQTHVKRPLTKDLQIMNAGEGMEKKEPSHIVDGNVNWYSHYGEQKKGSFLKKLKIELPYNSTLHSWEYIQREIYPKDTCSKMFIIPLFTTAKTWKQPKHPSTDEWIKKMSYIYIIKYYSAIKRMK